MTDIPAWIGAVGTVGTLSTGLVLFAGSMSDRRREYAKQVAVWTAFRKYEDGEGVTFLGPSTNVVASAPEFTSGDDPHTFELKMRNNGLQPIYECELRVALDRDKLPPGKYPLIYETLMPILGIVAPGIENSYTLLLGSSYELIAEFREAVTRALTFELRFTDTTGRRWVRDEKGRLRHLNRWRSSPMHSSSRTWELSSGG